MAFIDFDPGPNALITGEGALDGEDGIPMSAMFLREAIWMQLPDNYPLYFMELHDDY